MDSSCSSGFLYIRNYNNYVRCGNFQKRAGDERTMNANQSFIKLLLIGMGCLSLGVVNGLEAQTLRAFELQFKVRNYGIDMGLSVQRPWKELVPVVGGKMQDIWQTKPLDSWSRDHLEEVAVASPEIKKRGISQNLGREIQGTWIERTAVYYSIELGNLRDPREQLVVNERLIGSRPFKLNKVNHTWLLRPSIGKIWSVSERRSRNDVGFRLLGNLGVPVAYSWPIYIWLYQRNFLIDGYVDAKYDPSTQLSTEIGGTASWTRGVKQGKFTPGVSGSMGFQFEWGSYKQVTNSVTLGCSVDYFAKKIPNWYNASMNRNIFPAVFVTFAAGISKD